MGKARAARRASQARSGRSSPTDLRAPTDADRHIFIFEPARDRIIETFLARVSDGSNGEAAGDVYAPWMLAGPMRDSGIWEGDYEWNDCPWCGNEHRGTRAYGGSGVAGLIRNGELRDGLHHAVAIKAPANAYNRHSPDGNSDGFVWPASASDGGEQYGETGNVFMGSLLAIPADVSLAEELEARGITNP